jgi:hypothetical protein
VEDLVAERGRRAPHRTTEWNGGTVGHEFVAAPARQGAAGDVEEIGDGTPGTAAFAESHARLGRAPTRELFLLALVALAGVATTRGRGAPRLPNAAKTGQRAGGEVFNPDR